MKKYLWISFLIVISFFIMPSTALGSYDYYIPITVYNNNSFDLTSVPVVVSINNSQLASLGYILTSGLDTSILEGASERSYLVADNKTIIILPDINSYQSRTYNYRLGESTSQSNFTFSPGYYGNVSIGDSSSLELGRNFSIEFDGWIDVDGEDSAPGYSYNTSTSNTTEVSTHIVNLPSGISSGDYLFILFSGLDVAAGNPAGTCSGWTQLWARDSPSNCFDCFYKVATGTEGLTETVSTGEDTCTSAHMSIRLSNCIGVPFTSSIEGTSSDPDAPTLNISDTDNSRFFYMSVFMSRDGTLPVVSNYPTNYTGIGYCHADQGAYDSGVGAAYRDIIAIVDENATAFNTSSYQDYWAAGTIAIKRPVYFPIKKRDSVLLYTPLSGGMLNFTVKGSNYYYKESIFQDDWVEGYTSGTNGTVSKTSDHLYAYCNNSSQRTWVTNSSVNLTGVDTLYIDWSGSVTGVTNGGYLVVSTNKTGNYTEYDARLTHTNTFSRTTETLDVSSLSGSYYIRCHVRAGSSSSQSINAYNIYAGNQIIDLVVDDIESGEYEVDLWGNSTYIGVDIDGVTEDFIEVPKFYAYDSSFNWTVELPYFNYYKYYVNQTQKVWYEPVTMVTGISLTDRSGNGNTGKIYWGPSPDGFEVTVGGMEPYIAFTAPGAEDEGSIPDVLPDPGTLNPTGDTLATGVGLPLYTNFKRAADSLEWSVPTTYSVGFMIVSIVVGVAAMVATGTVWGWVLGFGSTSALFGQVRDGGGYLIMPLWMTLLCVMFAIFCGYVWKYT